MVISAMKIVLSAVSFGISHNPNFKSGFRVADSIFQRPWLREGCRTASLIEFIYICAKLFSKPPPVLERSLGKRALVLNGIGAHRLL